MTLRLFVVVQCDVTLVVYLLFVVLLLFNEMCDVTLVVYLLLFCCCSMRYCLPVQCRRILKLTTTMMSPHNFSAVEPVHLVTLNLSPKDETGLVSLTIMMAMQH